MPIIKSAKKRVRVASKATSQNIRTKRVLRAAQKDVRISLTADDKKALTTAQRKNQSALDVAGKKGLMHKHKVARKQRQLAAQVKAANLTKSVVKKTTTKAKVPSKK
jgi:small subunit ribosomal protein S20